MTSSNAASSAKIPGAQTLDAGIPGEAVWSEERVALLTKLWAEGLTASLIAGRLGGLSRNAVLGKVHRLGLPGRLTASRARGPAPAVRARWSGRRPSGRKSDRSGRPPEAPWRSNPPRGRFRRLRPPPERSPRRA